MKNTPHSTVLKDRSRPLGPVLVFENGAMLRKTKTTRSAFRTAPAFTFIETMTAMAIFTAISAALIALIVSFYILFATTESATGASAAADAVVHAAAADAAAADAIVAMHTFNGVTYTSGVSAAVFEIPTTNASSTLIANTFDYVAVVASGTEAYEITDAGTGSFRTSGTHRLTSVLSALSFDYGAGGPAAATTTTISATTSTMTGNAAAEAHLDETVVLRNHS